jgi:hypothetical protein
MDRVKKQHKKDLLTTTEPLPLFGEAIVKEAVQQDRAKDNIIQNRHVGQEEGNEPGGY